VKRKHRRLTLFGLSALGAAAAAALALTAFQDNLLFFYSPSDVAAKGIGPDRRFRLGGLVEDGSLEKIDGGRTIGFVVTDTRADLRVLYTGIPPDLFREGQGVIAHGALRADGVFVADELLAKHDENYMPPEVAKALEAAGHPIGGAQAAEAAP
jgi:cytochrome c-type biogenesis protein CcmE